MNKGYVYLIKCGEFPYYKIGKTANQPLERLGTLQGGCPFRLELKAYAGTADIDEAERKLQERFQFQCIGGEWYYFNAERLETVIEDYHILDEIGYVVHDIGQALQPLVEIDTGTPEPQPARRAGLPKPPLHKEIAKAYPAGIGKGWDPSQSSVSSCKRDPGDPKPRTNL